MGTRKNRLTEAVLTSTHDLCFRAKIRKNIYTPVNPIFYYIKVGCKGVYITQTCYPDELVLYFSLPHLAVFQIQCQYITVRVYLSTVCASA